MSRRYKSVPITAAKKISDLYEKDQVIIVTWDKKYGMTHVTTYGKTIDDCRQAAMGGNVVKKALGWPPDQCVAVPAKVKRRERQIERRKEKFAEIMLMIDDHLNVGDPND